MTTLYHIPVCPFSQRLKILLHLKGFSDAVDFEVVDITKPRDPALLAKSDGTTALPILELPDGRILKESQIILQYLDESLGKLIRRTDPFEHAIENLLISREGPFTTAGYLFVMNQKREERDNHVAKLDTIYREMNIFLMRYNAEGTFLFDDFGLAEAVFTPIFMRFWFLEYYEDYDIPSESDFDRVRKWRDACLANVAARQVTKEEIVKLYYDYALGYGNGAVPKHRNVSSFVFSPSWPNRPWPPKNKYDASVSDEALGLE